MSLFVCDECNCVENTALSGFWTRNIEDRGDGRALCSECDPRIGRWHGKFEKHEWDGDESRVVNRG